ncbi:MAG: mannose-1-phosphate guanylyltransferase/mannose-6-phosphate isomerase [Pseudomonadota bacterium]
MVEGIVPVILSGGSGSRLWPVSRNAQPKQFLKLKGKNSMLHDTLERVSPLGERMMVLCAEEQRFLVAEALRQANQSATITLEPVSRNTALSATVGAYMVALDTPDAIIILCPADHHVPDPVAFRDACHTAAELAATGRIVTLGITPARPETGYGYIQRGAALGNGAEVASFTEKPDLDTAITFLKDGGYYWNAGIFLAPAKLLLEEMGRHAPEIAEAAEACLTSAQPDLDFLRLAADPLEHCPALSFDYAVMERTDRAAVLPVDFLWSDLGTWNALWEMDQTGPDQNVAFGENVLIHDTKRSYVRSEGPLVSVAGVQDLVVIATNDAVLVTDRKRTENVKQVVEDLKQQGHAEATEHRRVHRPWGSYESLVHGDRFQVKRITVNPGGILSLQSHMHRSEHWVVVSGFAEVTLGEDLHRLAENESIYIPLGAKHRMANPGKVPLVLIEVQSGGYLGEDDIKRYEDIYRRD